MGLAGFVQAPGRGAQTLENISWKIVVESDKKQCVRGVRLRQGILLNIF